MIRTVHAPTQLDPSPFTPLPVGRPVDRYEYIKGCSRDLRVLDLGAYDETEVDRTDPRRRWLHAEIAGVASEVLGVDASEKLAATGGVTTTCGTRIIFGSVEDLDAIVADFRPDVIVAGELIEHTPHTLGWLSRLASVSPGVRFVATTPNATSIINSGLALARRENCHPDHLQIYSFRTLRTLAERVPMQQVTIRPYYYDPHLFFGRLPGRLEPVVSGVNRVLLHPLQFVFPLMAFGLILDGLLADG